MEESATVTSNTPDQRVRVRGAHENNLGCYSSWRRKRRKKVVFFLLFSEIYMLVSYYVNRILFICVFVVDTYLANV